MVKEDCKLTFERFLLERLEFDCPILERNIDYNVERIETWDKYMSGGVRITLVIKRNDATVIGLRGSQTPPIERFLPDGHRHQGNRPRDHTAEFHRDYRVTVLSRP